VGLVGMVQHCVGSPSSRLLGIGCPLFCLFAKRISTGSVRLGPFNLYFGGLGWFGLERLKKKVMFFSERNHLLKTDTALT